MRQVLLVISAALTGIAAVPALAAPQQLTGLSKTAAFVIDRGSIRKQGDTIVAWLTSIRAKDLRNGTAYVRSEVQYDCERWQTRLLYVATFKADGTESAKPYAFEDTWTKASARSVEEANLKAVCQTPTAPITVLAAASEPELVVQARSIIGNQP